MSSPAQAASQAVKHLMRTLGAEYDKSRGIKPFNDKRDIKVILDFFENKCCYCEIELEPKLLDKDHLTPMNKSNGGLHVWGNIVPSCKPCNRDRLNKDWSDFLKSRCNSDNDLYNRRKKKINDYFDKYQYKITDEQSVKIAETAQKLHAKITKAVKESMNEIEIGKFFS